LNSQQQSAKDQRLLEVPGRKGGVPSFGDLPAWLRSSECC
jgi:hypothetical protein